MDLIYCSDPSLAGEITGVLAEQPTAKPVTHKATGPWGAFVATDTPYWGYAPSVVDNDLFCILGDPLTSKVPVRGHGGAERTLGVARKWTADPSSVEPDHPAALIRARASRSVDIVTDAWGAVSLFYGVFEGDLYLATSPDLIALCVRTEVDPLSAQEFLATTQLSFPNTLYKGIKQVAPASHVTLTPNGLESSVQYWTAPLPLPDKTPEEWASRLQKSVTRTFKRIRTELGNKGTSTLSAGLDTRFLVAMATREKLLDVDAITVTPIRNQEFWIAKRAAHAMGVPHTCVSPPRGAYGERMVRNAPVIPSHMDRDHAHFTDQVLGEVTSPFLLGGYMADTILHFANPFYTMRRHAVRLGRIPADAPRWALTTFSTTLDSETADAISRRWQQSDALLGITADHEQSLVTAYPAARQAHIAHFQAAHREYPIYEPFMTRSALALGFKIPIRMKEKTRKDVFYSPYLDGLSSGMLVAGGSNVITKRVETRLKDVPPDKRPEWTKLNSAWYSTQGPSNEEYKRCLTASRGRTKKQFSGDYTSVSAQLCFQIARALDT